MIDLEIILVGGLSTRLLFANEAELREFFEILVQCLHPYVLTGLNRRIHLCDFVFANQISNRRGADHDFVGSHPSSTDFFAQRL